MTDEAETAEAAETIAVETTEKKPLDLLTLDLAPGAEAGAELSLRHPVTGAELGVTLHVIGADAASYRNNLRKIRDAAVAKVDQEPKDPDAANLLQIARMAAAAVTGWSGVSLGGTETSFSLDAAVSLMVRLPWIADQVASFRDARANFFKA